jgi:two-component system, OmpR family, response regulator
MPYRRFPRLRVLVVEDNPTAGLGLEDLYNGWGWRADWAASGEAGLIKAAVLEPDVIVLDHYLPDMDSLAFVARLGAAGDGRPAPPVIVFTAAWGPDLERVKAAGLRVVEKPKDPAELAAVLEEVVGGGRRGDGGGVDGLPAW